MKEIYIVHLQSESSENYYTCFLEKPSNTDILLFQKEKYISEYGEEPEDEYFIDLMGCRSIEKVKIRENKT